MHISSPKGLQYKEAELHIGNVQPRRHLTPPSLPDKPAEPEAQAQTETRNRKTKSKE